MATAASGIARALREARVKTVFGIPSVHNLALYEALRLDSEIRHVVCRHEASATHMADGYARAAGAPGVVISSTGPGAAFTVAPLHEAWGSCSPVVMITTDIEAAKIGRGLGALHELEDQAALFRAITKAVLCACPGDDLYAAARWALATAASARPGPVCLAVPTDVLSAAPTDAARAPAGEAPRPGAPSRLAEAESLLQKARWPVIIAGTGAARAGLAREITALAEALAAPVVTSAAGKGLIPEDHPLAFGNVARRGVVREMVEGCDLALAIGTRLREVDAKRRGLKLPALIHAEWDERWIDRNFPCAVPLLGDIGVAARELSRQAPGGPARAERQTRAARLRDRLGEEVSRIRDAQPELRYLEAIRSVLPRHGILVVDNTQLGYWAEYFYPAYAPGTWVAAKGSTLLGFSFPAAAGIKLALPHAPVVAVTGDGGFLYSAQELATCVRHGIAFPVVVVNDNAYGVIRYLQKTAYGKEYGSRLSNPDFVAFAASFGVPAERVRSPGELERALDRALVSGEMRLIELEAEFPTPPFDKY